MRRVVRVVGALLICVTAALLVGGLFTMVDPRSR